MKHRQSFFVRMLQNIAFWSLFAGGPRLSAHISDDLRHNVIILKLLDYLAPLLQKKGYGKAFVAGGGKVQDLYTIVERFTGMTLEQLFPHMKPNQDIRIFLTDQLEPTRAAIAHELTRHATLAEFAANEQELSSLLTVLDRFDKHLTIDTMDNASAPMTIGDRIIKKSLLLPCLEDTLALPAAVNEVCCTQDGNTLVINCPSIMKAYVLMYRNYEWRIIQTINAHILSMALSTDESHLALGLENGNIMIFDRDTTTDQWNTKITLESESEMAQCLCFAPHTNTTLFSGHFDGHVYIWTRHDNGQWNHRIFLSNPRFHPIEALVPHPYENILLVAIAQLPVALWKQDPTSKTWKISTLSDLREHGIDEAQFDSTGSLIAFRTLHAIDILRSHDLEKIQSIEFRNETQATTSLYWSPFGIYLGMQNGTIRLIRKQSDGQWVARAHTLSAHDRIVNSICASRNGTRMFSASGDSKVCIWNVNPAQTIQQALFLYSLSHIRSTRGLPLTKVFLAIWKSFDARTQNMLKQAQEQKLIAYSITQETNTGGAEPAPE